MSGVYCIGMGAVASFADNCEELLNLLLSGKTGIRNRIIDDDIRNNRIAAMVLDSYGEDKYLKIAEKALFEALNDAQINQSYTENNKKIGLVLGTSLANTTALEGYYSNKKKNLESVSFTKGLMNYVCNSLSKKLKLRGPCITISNTCASGVNAIGLGYELIKDGKVNTCIVGGVDIVGEFIYSGLNSVNAISTKNILQPFSKDRDGIILGEGAGFLVLSNQNKHQKYGEIGGYSITNDGVHITAPDKEGRGLIKAIKEGISMAELKINDINTVFCCGTGTRYNDAMQGIAIKSVWKDILEEITVTSIKPNIGHTLGAAGVLETIGIMLMMKNGIVTSIGENYQIDTEIAKLPLLHRNINKSFDKAILLSSGFSGVNGTLVLRKV